MSEQAKPPVGIIGLGAMGMGVAQSLLHAGFPVVGFDVRSAALAALGAAGGRSAATPAALAGKVEHLIVLVVSAEQVEQVLCGDNGAAAALPPGALVMQCATVAPGFARALGERLAALGLVFLDAPLSGGVQRAASGKLTVMASGSGAAFGRAEPILAAVAERVYRLGDAPGAGSTIKMINQLLAGVHIAAAAEAMAFGIRAGCDAAQLYDVISNSAGSSWMFQNRVPHILAGDYEPQSAVNIFVKDLGIVLDSARREVFPLPLTAAAHQQFLAAAAAGLGGEDDSAVVKVFAALTGIALPPRRE
ncbi:MAG: NAD(P)-dependent oxidoreductase [Alphaproteobacteria bacterium]|nr:NAD(P)-dependent oxidoreductase [Alphaproteobacteria bacterium]